MTRELCSPAIMPLLASTMIAVRPTLKIALWPKFSTARVEVVFREEDSYTFRKLSYRSASYLSLLKYWHTKRNRRTTQGFIKEYSTSFYTWAPAWIPQWWFYDTHVEVWTCFTRYVTDDEDCFTTVLVLKQGKNSRMCRLMSQSFNYAPAEWSSHKMMMSYSTNIMMAPITQDMLLTNQHMSASVRWKTKTTDHHFNIILKNSCSWCFNVIQSRLKVVYTTGQSFRITLYSCFSTV